MLELGLCGHTGVESFAKAVAVGRLHVVVLQAVGGGGGWRKREGALVPSVIEAVADITGAPFLAE